MKISKLDEFTFQRQQIELLPRGYRISSGVEDSMNKLESSRNRGHYSPYRQSWAAQIISLGLLCLAAVPAEAQEKKGASDKDQSGAGLIVSAQASAKEVGLPIYPDARPQGRGQPLVGCAIGLMGQQFWFQARGAEDGVQ